MGEALTDRLVPTTGGILGNAKATLKTIFSEPLDSTVIVQGGHLFAPGDFKDEQLTSDSIPVFSNHSDDFHDLAARLEHILKDGQYSLEKSERDNAAPPEHKLAEQVEIAEITAEALERIACAAYEHPLASVRLPFPRASKMEPPPILVQPPPAKPKRTPARQQRPIPVAAHFKLVFLSVFALTVLVGATFVALAVFVQSPTPGQTAAVETTRTLMVAGLGVIFGLLGGKSIQ